MKSQGLPDVRSHIPTFSLNHRLEKTTEIILSNHLHVPMSLYPHVPVLLWPHIPMSSHPHIPISPCSHIPVSLLHAKVPSWLQQHFGWCHHQQVRACWEMIVPLRFQPQVLFRALPQQPITDTDRLLPNNPTTPGSVEASFRAPHTRENGPGRSVPPLPPAERRGAGKCESALRTRGRCRGTGPGSSH